MALFWPEKVPHSDLHTDFKDIRDIVILRVQTWKGGVIPCNVVPQTVLIPSVYAEAEACELNVISSRQIVRVRVMAEKGGVM